jgi:hypothetical protein
LPDEVVERYGAEGAKPVVVDRERIQATGIRVREVDLLSEKVTSSVRHDSSRLAEEVCRVALVHL